MTIYLLFLALLRDNLNTKESILKVLVYFDIFRYPLTRKEIESFLDQPFPEEKVSESLGELLSSNRVFQLNEFYSLRNDISLAEIRKKGMQMQTY
jgi:hypothetical protein